MNIRYTLILNFWLLASTFGCVVQRHQLDMVLAQPEMAAMIAFSQEVAISATPSAPIESEIENADRLRTLDPDLMLGKDKFRFKLVKRQQSSPNGNCHLEVMYPQLTGLKDQEIQAQINQSLAELSQPAEASYQEILLSRENFYDYCTTQPSHERKIGISMARCRIELAKENLVSLVCDEMHTMAAYPIGYDRSLTFSLRTGEVYAYSDLFQPGVNYGDIMGQLIMENYFSSNIEHMAIEKHYLSRADADVYLTAECHDPKAAQQATCIVIANSYQSGVMRNHNFEVKVKQVEHILSADPDLQVLLK